MKISKCRINDVKPYIEYFKTGSVAYIVKRLDEIDLTVLNRIGVLKKRKKNMSAKHSTGFSLCFVMRFRIITRIKIHFLALEMDFIYIYPKEIPEQ